MRWQVKQSVYKELIRTDKHGNKIYKTNACKRCEGCGKVEFTNFMGGVCALCDGSGIGPERKTTEYTPAQQRLRSAKRWAKKLGSIEQQIRENGVNPDTLTAFWLSGNTYPHKEQIRDLGAVWFADLHIWACPVPFVADGVTYEKKTYKIISEDVDGFKFQRLMIVTR